MGLGILVRFKRFVHKKERRKLYKWIFLFLFLSHKIMISEINQMKTASGSANKKRKTSPWLSGLSSLPDEVAVTILAQVSRFDRAAFAIVSKRHRALVASPELCNVRRSETCLYVCLHIYPDPFPRWFILTPHRRLRPIPSNPYQAPESSSFVAVDGRIYVFGGLVNGSRTSDVSFLDCFSHTWHRAPSMMMARASASANLLDGKIYLMGGCQEDADEDTNWAEVFDLQTQTWHELFLPPIRIHQSVAIECEKLVYAVDVDYHRPAYVLPGQSTAMSWIPAGGQDSMPGEERNDWCLINKLLYCREGTTGRIMWCRPGGFGWFAVKGFELDKLQRSFSPRRPVPSHKCTGLYSRQKRIQYDLCRLISNSAGNLVIFWNAHLEGGSERTVELWSAEISLEEREGFEVWGKVEWSHPVFKLHNPLSPSYNIKVLFSASVLV